jgi:hypothetical protein
VFRRCVCLDRTDKISKQRPRGHEHRRCLGQAWRRGDKPAGLPSVIDMRWAIGLRSQRGCILLKAKNQRNLWGEDPYPLNLFH